ncbi:cell division protein FtsK [Lactobacillus sp. ESL0731]|uniref:cell division protein FtsK n=1 Tax=unclassified Lactobacillus TaxID=2620435 RepID=UPI0023FA3F7E|nr:MULTISPECIES: cell division protein FtsK [unclassified Lactobacillus]WEV51412.1 cell division protein FtsK [Lactobacillus sp. ESL0700]WEV62542.1 cell division protein FtsK [Lactobacillus sp. ESL0731]
MNKQELEQYLLQSLDMGLSPIIKDESSYNNSFDCKVLDDGFLFLPRLPSGYLVDDNLYEKIFIIANAALYPRFTLLKQNSAYFVPMDTDDIHTQRALFFPWKKGISKRLIIPNLAQFTQSLRGYRIPVMKNLSIDYDQVTSIALSGASGAGKTYLLIYLLSVLKKMSKLIVVDPKFDSPSRWAKDNDVLSIYPRANRSKSDLVSQVNDQLSRCLKEIETRQTLKFSDPTRDFDHLTIAIDETLSLTEGVNRTIKNSFFSLLSQIALMGRATRVHLLLVSQRFDFNTIPVSVREQLNVLIQIGNINSKTTQFLFPDLDPSGIVIPTGKGTGLIQVIDSEHPYQVLPLLCPTYYSKKV